MGWHSTLMHGKDHHNAQFGLGNKSILVTTDFTTPRLDVPDVVHVVNYDLPNEIAQKEHCTPPRSTTLLQNR